MRRPTLGGAARLARRAAGGTGGALARALEAGAPWWILSVAFVQGSATIIQLALVQVLDPATFASVRVLETMVALVAVPAAFGVPTAIARLAALESGGGRPAPLASALLVVAGLGTAVAAIAVGAGRALAPAGATTLREYLGLIAPVVVLGGLTRVVLGYWQGRLELRRAALIGGLPAMLAVPVVLGAASRWGLPGWAAARVMVEGLALVVVLWSARDVLRRPAAPREEARRLLGYSAGAVLALLLGRLFSSFDLLTLEALATPAAELGGYGAMHALYAALLLPVSAVNVVGFTDLARASASAGGRGPLLRLVGLTAAATLPVAVALVAGEAALVGLLARRGYELAWGVAPLLGASLVLEGITSCFGTYLFATARPLASAGANLVAFVGLCAAAAFLAPGLGSVGMAGAVALGNAIRLLLFGWLSWSVRPREEAA